MTYPDAAPISEERRLLRRQVQTEAWRRRSRLIHRLRHILPISIASIVVLLTGWVLFKGLVSGIGDGHAGGAAIHMTNARFQGRDGDGHAYVLAAAEVSRDSVDIGRLHLIKPFLIYNAESLKPTRIVADQGLFREDDHLLSLQGHVVAADGEGYVFRTSDAVVDTLHLVVNGWNKVTGSGPTGTITGDSFGIYDHGQTIVFSGDVHSILKRD